jgi:hypothetical protein
MYSEGKFFMNYILRNSLVKCFAAFAAVLLLLFAVAKTPLAFPARAAELDEVEPEEVNNDGADDNVFDGTVTLAVEALTVDAGLVVQPVHLTFSDGDTGVTLLERALSSTKINDGNGVGKGIHNIAAPTDFAVVLPEIKEKLGENVTGAIAESGWIANGDFDKNSKWLFILDNKFSDAPLESYRPADGDVIRIAFSVAGDGSDLRVGNGIFTPVNRDALYVVMADFDATIEDDVYDNAETDTGTDDDTIEPDGNARKVADTLLSEQDEINKTIAFLTADSSVINDDAQVSPPVIPEDTSGANSAGDVSDNPAVTDSNNNNPADTPKYPSKPGTVPTGVMTVPSVCVIISGSLIAVLGACYSIRHNGKNRKDWLREYESKSS